VKPTVRTGLDEFLARPRDLKGQRIGLISNSASVTRDLVHASRAIRESGVFRLGALFGPEHGIWANAQDLVEVPHGRDRATGLPVYSLYGAVRAPTEKMLKGVETLVFDLQDVGSRYYTFISTMLYTLEACSRVGRRLVVLDRPNPLGGTVVSGNVLLPGFSSFVGVHPLPARHGMTVGELALLFRKERNLDVDLRVVRMKGWTREMDWEQTGLSWVQPSPNMPTVDTAYVYPGGCLIEGTNLSEGRGTTRPFELVGAPWLDPWKLARRMNHLGIPGARFRPTFFTPSFSKHAGRMCGGVQVHVTNRRLFPAFVAYVLLIAAARRQDPQKFAWREPPYEYEVIKKPIDILCGTDRVRHTIDKGTSPWRLAPSWKEQVAVFKRQRAKHLLY
jgi:uncharacterized protein YbbC (DUF1343 family)